MGDSSREDASNTLRVLVATDCHLGYMEKDEVRRHDSFQAFEEICSIADQKQVDFLLLGGDLFHENKPSRSTLVKTIEILRRYTLNDRPVQFEVVSDQTVNFANIFGHVNYEDPHFNVGLPVFSIHGNHDDPAGVDNLSAVDILSACNLVNYFGKMVLGGSGVGQITLYPILIRKGSTLVALYGLGNIRDERLNRMFQTPHAVQWMQPEAQEGCQVSDWFNILAFKETPLNVIQLDWIAEDFSSFFLVKTNPKNAISEHFLPRFLDFIVWGHEHECLVDPQEVAGMGFHITQPGSSIATSLIDGESKPKHIVLKDEADIDPNDQTSILEHLDKVVRNLIDKASGKFVNGSELKLPLVRIKEKGGLGLRKIILLNKALLGKSVWRFAIEKDNLWKKVLLVKYGQEGFGWRTNGVRGTYEVGVWKEILKERCPKSSPSYILWRSIGMQRISLKEDSVFWKSGESGIFGVKDAYILLVAPNDFAFPKKNIWVDKAPTKAAFFIWEATWGKILTLDRLQK
ncbi:Double-strand break repair protein MRE11 [Vitis vinifera]|uniref:Double-strand break repair protein MRE11 n=1 Tax=Vitis vinifera TaxID=29760 RepID=A0A438I8T6_VITVI|nr:Double-strand break repair protein MRE11 [Vitis vinifera]